MPISKWKIIISISVCLNVVLVWYLFSFYQEINNMKKAIIIQYAAQQEEALRELERADDNLGNKEEYVKALTSAYGIIYHNEMVTRNYTPNW